MDENSDGAGPSLQPVQTNAAPDEEAAPTQDEDDAAWLDYERRLNAQTDELDSFSSLRQEGSDLDQLDDDDALPFGEDPIPDDVDREIDNAVDEAMRSRKSFLFPNGDPDDDRAPLNSVSGVDETLPLDIDFGPLDPHGTFVVTVTVPDNEPQDPPNTLTSPTVVPGDGTVSIPVPNDSLLDDFPPLDIRLDGSVPDLFDPFLIEPQTDLFQGMSRADTPGEEHETADVDILAGLWRAHELNSAFGLGLIIGFFKDGLWGTLEGVASLAEIANEFSLTQILYNDVKAVISGEFDQITAVRTYEAATEAAEVAATAYDAARPYLQKIGDILKDLRDNPAPLIRAFSGDVSQLNQIPGLGPDKRSQFAMLVLLVAADILPEILAGLKQLREALGDVSGEDWARLGGRVTGFIIYEIAEAFLTAGIVKVAKAGKYAEWLGKLRKLSGIAHIDESGRVAKALERLGELLAKFRKRISRGMSSEEAARLLRKDIGLSEAAHDAATVGAREAGEAGARRAGSSAAGNHLSTGGLHPLYDSGAQIVEEANRRNLTIVIHPDDFFDEFLDFAAGVRPRRFLKLDLTLIQEIKTHVALEDAGKPQRWTRAQVDFVRTHILPSLQHGGDQGLLRWWAFEPKVPKKTGVYSIELVPNSGKPGRVTDIPGDPEEGLLQIFSQENLDDLRRVFAGDGPSVRTGLGPSGTEVLPGHGTDVFPAVDFPPEITTGPNGTVRLSADEMFPRAQPGTHVDDVFDGAQQLEPPPGFDCDAPTWHGDASTPGGSQPGSLTETEQFSRTLIPGSDNPLAEIPVPPRDGSLLPFIGFAPLLWISGQDASPHPPADAADLEEAPEIGERHNGERDTEHELAEPRADDHQRHECPVCGAIQ